MSKEKNNSERIQHLYWEKTSGAGKPEEKGLPLKNPSQSLLSSSAGTSTSTSSTSGNSSDDKK